jgi:hypothetical protein
MRAKTLRASFVGVLLLVLFAGPVLRAQDDQAKEKSFTGSFQFGYRAVDTSGAYEKYREHLNLEKGVRLFNLDLAYLATDALKKLFDRIDLRLTNFGGDPFETFSLSILKAGTYKFRFDRRKSDYFYSDLQQVGRGALYDARRLDFTRTSDSGSFGLTLSRALDVYLDFNRQVKAGDGTTTLDLNRTEFEMDQPLSEKLTEAAIGLNLHFPRYSFVLEERVQEYSNSNSLFLPGYADGGEGASYPSSLSSFRLSQPYDFKANVHTLRFTARPLESLLVKGSARLSSQDTTLSYQEDAIGVDYLDYGFRTSAAGAGKFDRAIGLYDLDLTYLLLDKLALVGAVRYSDFSQTGSLTIDGATEKADFGFRTLGLEAGVQYQINSRLGLTLGYRNERRTLDRLETATYETETVRHGLFGNLKWNSKSLKLTVDYQRGDYDEPYTLISPTQFDRFRLTAKVRLDKFDLSAGYLTARTRNEIPGGVNFRVVYAEDEYADLWKSSNDQLNLRLGYRAAKLAFSAGYAWIDVKHDSTRLVAYLPYWTGGAGTFPWTVSYEGRSGLLDTSLSWTLDPAWKVGAYLDRYMNKGFWPIKRTMFRGYVEHTFPGGFVSQLGYRLVNFKETDSGANDYKAGILEFSFGYRWDR